MRCIDISDDQMASYVKPEERKSLDSAIVSHIGSCDSCRAKAAFFSSLHSVVNISPTKSPSMDELANSSSRQYVVAATKPAGEFRILKFVSIVSTAVACVVVGVFLMEHFGRQNQPAPEKQMSIQQSTNEQAAEALVKDLSSALTELKRVLEKQNSQMAELSAGSAQIAKNLAAIQQSNNELKEGYEARLKGLELDIPRLAAEVIALKKQNDTVNALLAEARGELADVRKQLAKPNCDLDGDGVVSRNDLRILEEAILTESENADAALDLNKDGKVDSADFLILTRMVSK